MVVRKGIAHRTLLVEQGSAPPSPPQIRLAGSLIKVVRFIFSHRGLIRYK